MEGSLINDCFPEMEDAHGLNCLPEQQYLHASVRAAAGSMQDSILNSAYGIWAVTRMACEMKSGVRTSTGQESRLGHYLLLWLALTPASLWNARRR